MKYLGAAVVALVLASPALSQTVEQSQSLAQDWDALDKSIDALHGAKAHVARSLGDFAKAVQQKDAALTKALSEAEYWRKWAGF